MKSGSWVNLALGAWLVVSPFALHVDGALMHNNIAIGVLAVIVALWAIVVPPHHHAAAWLGVAIGFWVFAAPWALGIIGGSSATLANNGLCGSLMVIFAIVRTLSAPLPARTAL